MNETSNEPTVQVPVSLIEQELRVGMQSMETPRQMARRIVALLSQSTPTAEANLSMQSLLSEPCETFTTQSRLTCADDSGRVLGSRYGATEYCWPCRLRAVYPQQNSTAPCCARSGDPNWHTLDGGHVVPPDVEEDTPVAPPSIADMVPGTTFVGRLLYGDTDHQFRISNRGEVLIHVWERAGNPDHIDPSTIREVTPPAE